MKSIVKELFEKICNQNYSVTSSDAMELYEATDSAELFEAANSLRKRFCPSAASVCSIINAKQGSCSENCRYCAQSAWWKTSCPSGEIIQIQEAAEKVSHALENRVSRISLVTAGRGLSGKDFEAIVKCFSELHERFGQMKFCASLGIISYEQMLELKKAGVVRYHHNIESSRNFFPNVCTTHSFDERLETIRSAKKAGLELCCGGIIGMGEGRQDRVDMALELRKISPQSIPINILNPIKGTPMQNIEPLAKDEILRTIAVFRFIMPDATLRTAAGRKKLGKNGIESFTSGANALISGDFLTVPGSTNQEDIQMLQGLGLISS